jgi:hypothetical protein
LALGQVLPRVLPFSSVNFIPPVLGKMKKLIIFLFIVITGLHNKPYGCGASVASAAGPFSIKKLLDVLCRVHSNFMIRQQIYDSTLSYCADPVLLLDGNLNTTEMRTIRLS